VWATAELDQMPVTERTSLDHLRLNGDQSEGFLPWLTSLDLAKDLGYALWSDDIGLRALAQTNEVPTFGTVALLEVLRDDGVISEPALQTALRSLRQQFVVDLPLDDDWMLRSAAGDGWLAGPAAIPFSRAATWADELVARRSWSALATQAAKEQPMLVVGWLHAAAIGLVKARGPRPATRSLVEFASHAIALADFDPEVLSAAARAVRIVAEDAGLPGTAPLLIAHLMQILTEIAGPADAARILSAADLDHPEREALRSHLFQDRLPNHP
jgi:hypothetical protein